MNTRLEKSVRSSDEWYTPKEILDALGKFDLDPCAPIRPLWPTAEVMYDQNIDGLSQIWEGRVWLNPPYSRPLIELFVRKLAEHGNVLHSNLTLTCQKDLNLSIKIKTDR